MADLDAAVSAAADGVGFIVATTHDSEDELTVLQARELSLATTVFVDRVLVTHATDPEVILHLADEVGVDVIQVHGEVSRETVRSVWRGPGARRVVAVVHVTGPEAVESAVEVARLADAVLLDSRTATRLGPYGVDANSRLKNTHGRKDAAACAEFVAAARIPA
jgi:phosphoribosylanthranilate isomerase